MNGHSRRLAFIGTHFNQKKINYSRLSFGVKHLSPFLCRSFASSVFPKNEVHGKSEEFIFEEATFEQGKQYDLNIDSSNLLLEQNDTTSSKTILNDAVNVLHNTHTISGSGVSSDFLNLICDLNASGIPLWQIFGISIIGMRVLLLPISYFSIRFSLRFKLMLTEITKMQKKIQEDPTIPESEKLERINLKNQQLLHQYKVNPFLSLKYGLLQLPFYYIFFGTARHAIEILPTGNAEEFFLFSNLAALDNTLILPIISTALTYVNN